jgi:hypothetical protein
MINLLSSTFGNKGREHPEHNPRSLGEESTSLLFNATKKQELVGQIKFFTKTQSIRFHYSSMFFLIEMVEFIGAIKLAPERIVCSLY